MSVLGITAIPIDSKKYRLSARLRSFKKEQNLAKNITQRSQQLNCTVCFTEQDVFTGDKGKLIKMNYREIKRP